MLTGDARGGRVSNVSSEESVPSNCKLWGRVLRSQAARGNRDSRGIVSEGGVWLCTKLGGVLLELVEEFFN